MDDRGGAASKGTGSRRRDPASQRSAEARIAELSNLFLTLGPEQIESAIREQLAFAAELAGADSARLVVVDLAAEEVIGAYDWCNGEEANRRPPRDAAQGYRFVWSRQRLLRGEVVQVRTPHDLPPEAENEREDLLLRGTRSMLLLPVRSGDGVVGALLFETHHQERLWSDLEIARLRLVVEIFAGAIERGRAELALRESESRFRAFAENAMELVAEFDPDGSCRYVSPSCLDLLGREPSEWIGRGGEQITHPDDRELAWRAFSAAFRRGEGVHMLTRLRHRDGRWRWFETSGRVYRARDGSPRLVSMGRDVTRHRDMVETLERQLAVEKQIAGLSRRFLALDAEALDGAIREAVQEAAAIARADRGYLYASGRPDEHPFSRHYEWCAEGVASYPGERRPWSLARLMAGEILHFDDVADVPLEADLERKSLARRGVKSLLAIPVRVSGRLAVLGFECSLAPQRWSEHDVTLLRLIGEILASAIGRWHTDQVLRENEARLQQAQKLEAVGRLAGGIAHDFNNLLTVILGFSRPLLRELAPGDPVREDVAEIHGAAERAAGLTRQLLTFSRRQPVEESVVDLNAILEDLTPLLGRLLGEDIQIALELERGLDTVKGDPHQFEQLILNLAANARDAMPDGGQFLISTAHRTLDEQGAKAVGLARAGRVVLLTVTDSGEGIDDATRAQIFDPFFTTKEPGKGTGLGLSIAYSVVERAGGVIGVRGGPGKGATFEIWLPAATRVARERATDRMPAIPGGSETILLVEDEPAVRRLTGGILRRAGYTVIEACDGVDALDRVGRHPGPIHALISDVVMPRMGGYELARRLAATHPGARTLFMSGYPGESDSPDAPAHPVLAKPYSDEALLGQLRSILD